MRKSRRWSARCFETKGSRPAGSRASSLPRRLEVDRIEPDVVLLDGDGSGGYGQSWSSAAWLRARRPAIPVIMFTAHNADLAEAQLGVTERSQQASFVGFVAK